mgnify:CR=1 FL=1
MAMGCRGLNHKKGIISLSIPFKKKAVESSVCDEGKKVVYIQGHERVKLWGNIDV